MYYSAVVDMRFDQKLLCNLGSCTLLHSVTKPWIKATGPAANTPSICIRIIRLKTKTRSHLSRVLLPPEVCMVETSMKPTYILRSPSRVLEVQQQYRWCGQVPVCLRRYIDYYKSFCTKDYPDDLIAAGNFV